MQHTGCGRMPGQAGLFAQTLLLPMPNITLCTVVYCNALWECALIGAMDVIALHRVVVESGGGVEAMACQKYKNHDPAETKHFRLFNTLANKMLYKF